MMNHRPCAFGLFACITAIGLSLYITGCQPGTAESLSDPQTSTTSTPGTSVKTTTVPTTVPTTTSSSTVPTVPTTTSPITPTPDPWPTYDGPSPMLPPEGASAIEGRMLWVTQQETDIESLDEFKKKIWLYK